MMRIRAKWNKAAIIPHFYPYKSNLYNIFNKFIHNDSIYGNLTSIPHNNNNVIYDAIIIGGGHNGLVTGCYLSRSGKRVLILERRHQLGGAACTEEIYPGYKYSRASY